MKHGEYDGALCICPTCGMEVAHRRGFPCFRQTCPACGFSLERSEKTYTPTSVPAHKKQGESLLKKPPYVIQEDCISCGICIDACEFDAIHFVDGLAWIDRRQCTLCGDCLRICPRDAIKEKE